MPQSKKQQRVVETRETRETKEKKTQKETTVRTKKAQPKKKMHNKLLGQKGEDAAVSFLERRGFVILERNWKCVAGEADIIALDEDAIHFIEVKTRMGEGKGFPAEAVDARKRQRYEQIAELYLNTYDGYETGITFDIISINVLENERAMLRIYKNVLSCDCA